MGYVNLAQKEDELCVARERLDPGSAWDRYFKTFTLVATTQGDIV